MDNDWSQFDVDSALDLILDHSTQRSLERVCSDVLRLTSASGVAVALREGEQYLCRASCGEAPEIGVVVNLDAGVSAECIKQATTVIHNHQQGSIGSMIAAAVVHGDAVVGMIAAFASRPGAFTALHAKVLEGAAESLAKTLPVQRGQQNSNATVTAFTDDELENALLEILALGNEPAQRIVEEEHQPELAEWSDVPAITAAAQSPSSLPGEAVSTDLTEIAESESQATCSHIADEIDPMTSLAVATNPISSLIVGGTDEKPTASTPDILPIAVVPTTGKTLSTATRSFPAPRFQPEISRDYSRRPIWIALAFTVVVLLVAALFVPWSNRPQPPGQDPVPTSAQTPANTPPESAVTADMAPAEPTAEPFRRERATTRSQSSADEAAGISDEAIPIAAGVKVVRALPEAEPDAPPISTTPSTPPLALLIPPQPTSSLPILARPAAEAPEPPRLITRFDPVYPAGVAAVHAKTPVVLTVTITPDGRVASVVPNSGHPAMIRSAVEAVRRWRYNALPVNAPKIDRTIKLTVRFNLR